MKYPLAGDPEGHLAAQILLRAEDDEDADPSTVLELSPEPDTEPEVHESPGAEAPVPDLGSLPERGLLVQCVVLGRPFGGRRTSWKRCSKAIF